jgi:tRNA (guanine9-N1)-methyltransferase
MESVERPKKLRKLSHEGQLPESTTPHDREASDLPHDNGGDMNASSVPIAQAEATGSEITSEDAASKGLDVAVDAAPSVTTTEVEKVDPPLSKNQQKKLRRKAEWEAKRDDRKALRKEKLNAKRERKREEKKQAEAEGKPLEPAKHFKPKAVQLPITFMLDCDFDDLMRDGERTSLASQITRCYSDNKNAPFRAHLTINSFTGKLRERFDTVLTPYKAWRGVRWFESNFVETAQKAKEWMCGEQGGDLAAVFSKYADMDETAKQRLKDEGEIVYLSSEANEDLTELKPYSTYIIGGLVDKNREKGICHRRATNAGVRTARLPIGEYMNMQSRKVLATNHVNEIMIRWLESGDWGDAFLKVIPKRKGGQLKGANGERDGDESDSQRAGSVDVVEEEEAVMREASDE